MSGLIVQEISVGYGMLLQTFNLTTLIMCYAWTTGFLYFRNWKIWILWDISGMKNTIKFLSAGNWFLEINMILRHMILRHNISTSTQHFNFLANLLYSSLQLRVITWSLKSWCSTLLFISDIPHGCDISLLSLDISLCQYCTVITKSTVWTVPKVPFDYSFVRDIIICEILSWTYVR